MSIIKYSNPDFVPNAFTALVDRLFDHSLNRDRWEPVFAPRADVLEHENEFEIQLAVAGLQKDDFKLEVNDSFLTVSGERKLQTEKKGTQVINRETSFGMFSRSFQLPDTADVNGIKASYQNGILEIHIPKDTKKTLKRVIEVK